VFILDGGEISGNFTNDTGAAGDGGGVRVEFGGRFDMRSGTISGNSSGRDGGGVHVVYGGTFNMFNGTISDNAARNGGGVFTAGAFRMGNGFLHGANAADELMNVSRGGTSAPLHVAGGTALVGTFNPVGEFTQLDDLATVNTTIHVVNGVVQMEHDGDGGVLLPGDLADQFQRLRVSARDGGSYVIEISGNSNISPTEAALPTGRSEVTITVRGAGEIRLSSNGVLFTVGYGVTLVLDENVALVGRGGTGSHVPPGSPNNNHLVRINNGGTLIMNAGSRVTGNRAAVWVGEANGGGGVRVNNGGVFILDGGEISGNFTNDTGATGDGGGVRVEAGGRFDMRSGTISGNSSGRDGGGVRIASGGTFNMFSGTISGNSARHGGGVYTVGTFRMSNGFIHGNNAAEGLRNAGSGGTSASLSVAGTALTGIFNPVGEFSQQGILATVNVTIHVVDGVLQVEHDGYGSVLPPGITLADRLAWLRGFVQDGMSYVIEISGNENISPAEAVLPAGLSNVTITVRGIGGMQEIRLSSNGVLFTVGYGVTLVLDENVTLVGRRVGGHGGANNNNHLVRINNGGTLIMNAGARVTGNWVAAWVGAANGGGGVRVNNGGVFILDGGEISGNSTNDTGTTGDGGGVRVEAGGRFDMRSGTISGNSSGRDGGGVSIASLGTFNMFTGTIFGNSARHGGGVYTAGTFRMGNGIIHGNNAVEGLRNVGTGGTSASLSIAGTGTALAGMFNYEGVFAQIDTLATVNVTIHLVNGILQVDHDGDGIIIVPGVTLADRFAWLRGFARSGNRYRVEISGNENISPAEAVLPAGLNNVTITVRGIGGMREIRLSSNGVLFTVGYGVTLVLDENVTLVGRRVGGHGGANNNNHLVRINNNGTLIMNARSMVTGNWVATSTAANGGGGIRVNNGGVFILDGGEISGNSASNTGATGDGGGVRIEAGGRFDMRSGTISGNSSGRDGGGIFNAGIFRISDGIIYGNDADGELRNTGRNGAALFSGGIAQRGIFSNGEFVLLGALSSTSNTMHFVNGISQQ